MPTRRLVGVLVGGSLGVQGGVSDVVTRHLPLKDGQVFKPAAAGAFFSLVDEVASNVENGSWRVYVRCAQGHGRCADSACAATAFRVAYCARALGVAVFGPTRVVSRRFEQSGRTSRVGVFPVNFILVVTLWVIEQRCVPSRGCVE